MNNLDNNLWLPEVRQEGGHMIMEKVSKPSKIKYMNIDSRFQEEYNLNKGASFMFQLPQKITGVMSIAVRCTEIPMSFFNFSAKRGNTSFVLSNILDPNNITSTNYNIPDGNYTLNGLQTQMNAILNNVNVDNFFVDNTPDPNNTNNALNPFTSITYTTPWIDSGAKYQIHWDVDICGNFQKYNFKSSLGWCLGFRQQNYIIPENGPQLNGSPQQNMLNSEGVIDINNTRYLFLVVDEFRTSNPNSFLSPLASSLVSKNILARITLNTAFYPYGTILTANTFNGLLLSDQRVYAGKTDIQKLQISLVDERGNVVDLNGIDFSFCLEIEHE